MTQSAPKDIELPPEMGARIPPMPKGMDHLLGVLGDENLDFDELVGELELYPSVVARLLSLANSAWSAPVTPVTSVSLACGRLGLDMVRSVVLALTVAEPFDLASCPTFDARRYWSSALTTAEAASLVSGHAGIGDMQKARTAALLRNIGLLWLADSLPDETAEALEAYAVENSEEDQDLESLLQRHCGMGYLEAGRVLSAYWGLPEEFAATAYASCSSQDAPMVGLPLAVCLGSRLSRLVREEDAALPPLMAAGVDRGTLARVWSMLQRHYRRLEGLAEQLCG